MRYKTHPLFKYCQLCFYHSYIDFMKENRSVSKLYFGLSVAAAILIFNSSSAQWIRKADGFKTRSEVVGVVYKSKLYTFLGFSNYDLQTEPTSEVYDPATNTWKLLASIPASASMTHQGVALVDSTVWHIGGRVGQNPGPLSGNIWIYNINTNAWYRGPQIKDPATGNPLLWGGGGAVLLGRTLHLIGGFIINACNNDQSSYHLTLDVDSWLADTTKPAQWLNILAPLPVKRNHFSTITLGGKIYAIGGQFGHDCNGGLDKQYAHVYNPPTDTWTQLPLLPAPRSHIEGSTFAIDGKIFIAAGQGNNGASTNKVTLFDPQGNNGTGTWKDDSSLTLPKSYEGVSAKVINNTFIYSHGGEGSSSETRKETYGRTIVRNPVYKLGFSSGCLGLTADSGKIVIGKTLLFTIDSTKTYITSSNASWLKVSKNAEGTAIPNAVDIELTANTAGLAPGFYSGTITATGTGSGPAYSPAAYCVSLTVKGPNSSDTLQAEKAILYGAKIASDHAGYSGNGFADYINSTGDYIQWTINKSTLSSTLLNFRYANGGTADRALKLEVNGVVISSSLSFAPTGSWTKWSSSTATANLDSGVNTVKLTAIGASGPNVDYIAFGNNNTVQTVKRTIADTVGLAAHSVIKMFVSPNPAAGNVRLFLNTSSLLPANAEIMDITGKVYKKMKLTNPGSDIFNFSVTDLRSGVYIVRVRQGNNAQTAKFVVDNKN
jgi:hypothetical protein